VMSPLAAKDSSVASWQLVLRQLEIPKTRSNPHDLVVDPGPHAAVWDRVIPTSRLGSPI